MSRVDHSAALEIASHEAVVRQAYKDSGGVWTWSVGLTSACGHDVTRYIGRPQTMEHCLRIYAWALEKYADDVREAFRGHTLTKAQFAAALSFHWNTGGIKRASWVNLWKQGKIAEARRAFMNWRRPAGIIPRRRKERDLFFDGKWSNDGTIIEYTRLTRHSTPDWSSAKRVNIETDLRVALGLTDAKTNSPSLPLPGKPERPSAGKAGSLAAAIIAIGAALVGFWDSISNFIGGLLP